MMKRSKDYIQLLAIAAVIFGAAYAIKSYLHLDYGDFGDPKFLFNYLGVVLGFGLTLYTFIVSQYGMVEQRIKELNQSEKVEAKKTEFREVCAEVKDDVWVIFIILLLVILSSIVPEEYSKRPMIDKIISVTNVTFFVLSILAIKDLIQVSFKLADFIGVNVKK